ncbi:MAG: DUF971 domain-containing protein [Gemmatimonadota bacterium]
MAVQHVVPKAIRRLDDRIEFQWSVDHVGDFAGRSLRLACPCAACIDEMSGRPLLDPASVPDDIRADTITAVGAYGIRVRWSDGHATGIYTYAMILGLCPCPACAAAK